MTSYVSDRDFTKNFIFSCLGHAALVLLALVGGKLVSTIFKNNDIEIIRSAVRVDVVGMPKFTVQELKVMQKEPVAPPEPEVAQGKKEETKTEVEDVIKKDDLVIEEQGKKKKKESFLNMLSDYSAKKVTAKETPKGTKSGKSRQNLDSLILEGNRLSQGSALVGDYSDEQTTEFQAYVQALPQAIQPHWKLPSFLLEANLKCRIKIFLSTNGSLVKSEIVESSGNPEFDSRAMAAIKSSTFPKPPEAVGARLTSSGIILGFPL